MEKSWSFHSIFNVNTIGTVGKRKKNSWWQVRMVGKELSATQIDFLDACRRGDILKVAGYINGKKAKKSKNPLSIFRPNAPGSGWLANLREPGSLYTPLHAAALNGHSAVARLLLDADALLAGAQDKKDCVPLHFASFNGHTDIAALLIIVARNTINNQNCAKETPLHLAAHHGHVALTTLLLENNANVMLFNARGETPLDIAARSGHDHICRILLRYCPELVLQSANLANGIGKQQTVYPLHAAARHSHLDCIMVLRGNGFDMDFVTNEGTALHVAAMFGQVDACIFLLENGTNPHIKDAQGRTVLQVLEDHQRQKPSDVTQVIQSKDGWLDCQRVIEEFIDRNDVGTVNSSSDSGIDVKDFRSRKESYEEERDVIWKRHPIIGVNGQERLQFPFQPKNCDPERGTVGRTNTLQQRPNRFGTNSPVNTRNKWQSDMYDPHTGSPRFPLTSPYMLQHHRTVERRGATLPAHASNVRTKPKDKRGSILDPHCAFNQKQISNDNDKSLNMSYTVNPGFAYDNVPHTSAAYEEFRNRQVQINGGKSIGRVSGQLVFEAAQARDGHKTLPNPRRIRPSLQGIPFSPIHEVTANMVLSDAVQEVKNRPIMGSTRSLREREDSIGIGRSPLFTSRAGSRQSSLAFACSTLERSISPVTSHSTIDGRAPLALPEDMTGSTSASITNSTPERDFRQPSNLSSTQTYTSSILIQPFATIVNEDRHLQTPTNLSTSQGSLSFDFDSPPSPNTSQQTIFSFLSAKAAGRHDGNPQTNQMLSPTSTECSGSTLASSSSLPMVSQISQTNSSTASPTKDKSSEGLSRCTIELAHANNCGYARSTSGTGSTQKRSESFGSDEVDEKAEWRNIDNIMASYGCAMTDSNYSEEKHKASVSRFLKHESHKARTLKQRQSHLVEEDDSTISSWLAERVGIERPLAQKYGHVLEEAGFDSTNQLHGCLTEIWLERLGVPMEISQQILTYLSTVEDKRGNAAHFNYISDWLTDLELIEYLGKFFANGYHSMLQLRMENLSFEEYKARLNIIAPGHIARMLHSLQEGKREDNEKKRQRIYEMKKSVCDVARRNSSEDDSGELPQVDPDVLLNGSIAFAANYLGTMETTNVNGTGDSRLAMHKIKKELRNSTVTPVILDISAYVVDVLDAESKFAILTHEVTRIQIVCQDNRDLNFFAYTTAEQDRYFCHVFCVLTADIATEAILALGKAFDLAYGLAIQDSTHTL